MATNYTRNYSSNCVTARVTRAKQLFSENFPLSKHETWERAEKAARRWLKRIRPELPEAIPAKGRMTSRNASGIVGVQLKTSVKAGGDGEWVQHAWQGFWPAKPGGSSWAVVKYGDNQAFVCAVLARRLETSDRAKVEAEYARIKGTPEYRAILRRKAMAAP